MRKIILSLLFVPFFASSQKLSTIEEKTNGFKKFEGYLNFYWDENAGKIWLEIDKLDSELLYQTSLPAGLGSNDIGLDRGLLGNTCRRLWISRQQRLAYLGGNRGDVDLE